ncbi:stage II sporulation protein M [Candidatus Woesearchaeota archaeon]|nr:stage II sporulation protein M [Candidatus Woesearchaeota archaeon]
MGFSDEVRRARDVLLDKRYFILSMLALLLVSAVAGFYYPGEFAREQEVILRKLVSLTFGKGFFELFLIILLNNLRTALIGIVLGVFFGLVPLSAVLVNGYFVGAMLNQAYRSSGLSVLLLILPHGIFEIPALAIAFGMGVSLGLWWRERRKLDYIRKSLNDSILVYLYIILPLLVIAALVESSLISLS